MNYDGGLIRDHETIDAVYTQNLYTSFGFIAFKDAGGMKKFLKKQIKACTRSVLELVFSISMPKTSAYQILS